MLALLAPQTKALKDGSTLSLSRWHPSRGKITVSVGPDSPSWVSYSELSQHTINALVVAEDAKFFEHSGIDLSAIWTSLKLNLRRGRVVRGASTITQQVVRMARLNQDKTLIRKVREAIGALLLERSLSKERILEWYVNLTEFGQGVYGLRNAAETYFASTPDRLTVNESIHLAIILPGPNARSRALQEHQLSPKGHQRFATVLSRLHAQNLITKQQFETSLATGNFGSPIGR